jgi:uncharacterized protein YbaP (TraB family)
VIHFAPIIQSAAVCGAIISGSFFSNAARAEPAIWVIHDNDSTIYLVGTLHLLRRQTEWESAKLQKAQQQSSELWLEIVNPDDQLAAFPLIQKYGFDRERPLSSKLTPAQRERLAKIGAQYNFPVTDLESMKPWLAALTLTVLPVVKAGFDPSAGVDRSLFEEAKKEGHKIVGLETLEQQVRLLANLSEKEQLDLLESTFDDVEKGAAMLEKVAAAWMNGDTKRSRPNCSVISKNTTSWSTRRYSWSGMRGGACRSRNCWRVQACKSSRSEPVTQSARTVCKRNSPARNQSRPLLRATRDYLADSSRSL